MLYFAPPVVLSLAPAVALSVALPVALPVALEWAGQLKVRQ